MSHSHIADSMREELIRQLVYFDENRRSLLEKLTTSPLWEQQEVSLMLQQYVQRIEKVVGGFAEDVLQSRVLIGSRVLLRFDDEGSHDRYRIVLPDDSSLDDNKISCLSPIGRTLLLSKCGDTLGIRTNMDDFYVKVLENEYLFG